MADKEIEFAPGVFVKPPHEKAPSFVKAQISFKVAELGMWLREKHKAGEEWLNLDIKEAKSGKWYASVSTYKPKEKEPEKPAGRFADMKDDDPDEDIPY